MLFKILRYNNNNDNRNKNVSMINILIITFESIVKRKMLNKSIHIFFSI